MLNVQITSEEKGSLYTLQIDNTQLDDSKNIGGYAASLSGVGLETPLTVKLRKFNRSLGAVKLTSRVLGRIFRKHMDKLVTMTSGASPPPVKARRAKTTKTPKTVKATKTAKANGEVTAAAAPAPEP